LEQRIKLRVEEVLKQRRRSLYWLARNTGISYTTLWRLTKDRALGINFSTLEKLCAALECSLGDVIELENVEEAKPKGNTRRMIAGAS